MTTKHYTERNFEEHIEEYLLVSGYHSRQPGDYDKTLCLIPAELLTFIQSSQPQAYQQLEKQFGPDTPTKLAERLATEVNKRGTLDVLRNGIKTRGVQFQLTYRRPANQMNPDHWALYRQNRFSVVRQLKYSQKNENSIDMVLFLNGLPIVTAELKNSLTGQFVENAIKQYKEDRLPKGEPFLQYKRCLVHFAVGNEKAFMTTRLQGSKTHFFPFNLDTENPINPTGHKTAYLWEDIWQPDTLLLLISNYLHIQSNTDRTYDAQQGKVVEVTSEAFIFPRYHQLDVVRKVLTAVHQEGAGHSYLIQHSAGSGKSNSIAWLAHQLANLYQHPSDKERLFDSIIVVTDRRVLDSQLQNTIKQFEQTAGVVVPIDKDSQQLKKALEDGKAIIITTLQKFPVISQTTAALKGQKFAVIIDEAHSSQSGESAKHLKQVLSPDTAESTPEEAEFDIEDAIVEEIRLRGRQDHISYFAFTATPKNKTLELFGRQTPDDGPFVAFHNYWMRQAIEENFILDVLKNYTTFERYFKLVKKIEADKEYEKQKALTLLKSHVDLQPHAIEMKTRIMLEHFVSVTANAIQGRGRAMVVTQSKQAAIRYWQAFRKQMAERNLPYKPLVAFTGKVKNTAHEEYTEAKANQLPPKVSIPDALKTPEYRILIVVDKFQTGFDEPLLHTMYVDKKLRDVNAVQTLSRLNRTLWSKGKNDTVVLDFVNTADDIQKAFQPYYQSTLLEDETDPDKLYDLQHDLEKAEVYTAEDVEAFAAVFYDPKVEGERLQPILDRVVDAWKPKPEEDREAFRATLRKYIRFYGFVSQLLTFEDTDLEKLYAFARHLNRKLPRRNNRLPYEIRDAVDLDSFRIEETYKGSIALLEQDSNVPGLSASPGTAVEDEHEQLSIIIELLNETYGINITDEDKVDMSRMKQKLFEHDELAAAMTADNSLTNMEAKFSQLFDQMLLEFVHNKLDLYKKLSEPNVNQQLKRHWFDGAYREYHGGMR